MKKKNTRTNFKYMYPLPNRTVLYSHKKHLKPIPEAGKRYHCFDDGKISPKTQQYWRQVKAKADEILNNHGKEKVMGVLGTMRSRF